MDCIIVDLDNCIFNDGHRKHHLEVTPKNWNAYFDECDKDEPFEWAEFLIDLIDKQELVIIFLTGRPDRLREKTQDSLLKYFELAEDDYSLFMRTQNDYRKAEVYKEHVIRKLIADGGLDIYFAVDDDCKIAEMYKRNGITCLVPWNQRRE